MVIKKKIRILWFVNVPFPVVCKHLGIPTPAKGWWLVSMAEALQRTSKVELGIVWVSPESGNSFELKDGGVSYFTVPTTNSQPGAPKISKIINYIKIGANVLSKSYQPCEPMLQKRCQQAIETFSPDLVHINGTENFYGLLTPFINGPVLISLQGILNSIIKDFWGRIPVKNRFLYLREILSWLEMRHNANREIDIFKKNLYFSGRTLWDKTQQHNFCPTGNYFNDESRILRDSFYHFQWDLDKSKKHTIYITTTSRPYKGLEVLIDALAILQLEFPNIQLRIGGTIAQHGYGKYIRQIVNSYGLKKVVHFLGYVHTEQIIQELLQAHVYVLPSFIENSPNSLAEAQIVGVPCVASCSGGTPSLVEDGKTGLLFPKGDAAVLATCIKKIFTNDQLAVSLSLSSHKTASHRHNPKKLINTYLNLCQRIIDTENHTMIQTDEKSR